MQLHLTAMVYSLHPLAIPIGMEYNYLHDTLIPAADMRMPSMEIVSEYGWFMDRLLMG